MNLSIKDLEVSKDLSREERAAVHGGSVALGAVPTLTQGQGLETNTLSSNGKGGVQNVFVDVDANQSGTIKTIQKAEDNDGNFVFALGLMRGLIG